MGSPFAFGAEGGRAQRGERGDQVEGQSVFSTLKSSERRAHAEMGNTGRKGEPARERAR